MCFLVSFVDAWSSSDVLGEVLGASASNAAHATLKMSMSMSDDDDVVLLSQLSQYVPNDEREQPVARESRTTVVTHRQAHLQAHARPVDDFGHVVVRSRRRRRPAVDDSSDDFACEGASSTDESSGEYEQPRQRQRPGQLSSSDDSSGEYEQPRQRQRLSPSPAVADSTGDSAWERQSSADLSQGEYEQPRRRGRPPGSRNSTRFNQSSSTSAARMQTTRRRRSVEENEQALTSDRLRHARARSSENERERVDRVASQQTSSIQWYVSLITCAHSGTAHGQIR